MKSILVRILIIAFLVTCFGSGIAHAIDCIEDRLITMTVELIENSEFIYEVRVMVNEIAKDVISEMLRSGVDLNSVMIP